MGFITIKISFGRIILDFFSTNKSKLMSCFLLMWVHHRFTRIRSTLDHSSNSNCYFVTCAESFSQLRTSASFTILVQEFASIIHHLQRPNEFLVNFKSPQKSRENIHNLPPTKKNILPTFFVWDVAFLFVEFQEYKFGDISKEAAKRAKSAMANLLGQVALDGCCSSGELDGNSCPKILPHIQGG